MPSVVAVTELQILIFGSLQKATRIEAVTGIHEAADPEHHALRNM